MSPIIENCRLIICKDCQDVGTKLWNLARPRLCVLGSGSDTGGRRRRWGGTCRASQLRPHTGLGSLNKEQKRPIYCCMLRPLATFEYTDMRRNGHSFPPWQIRCPILNKQSFGIWLAASTNRSASLVGCRLATIFRRSIVLVAKSVCLCQFTPPFDLP